MHYQLPKYDFGSPSIIQLNQPQTYLQTHLREEQSRHGAWNSITDLIVSEAPTIRTWHTPSRQTVASIPSAALSPEVNPDEIWTALDFKAYLAQIYECGQFIVDINPSQMPKHIDAKSAWLAQRFLAIDYQLRHIESGERNIPLEVQNMIRTQYSHDANRLNALATEPGDLKGFAQSILDKAQTAYDKLPTKLPDQTTPLPSDLIIKVKFA